ncbi:MAG: hypothetical protein FWE67_07635, partial [Planctomycetaceae bacterium]|nr:hypothetical protein [Planctomycetaceae bacterium]
MLNLMENPIVKTISAADKSIDETILSAVRDMNETRSSAEADIAELQAAQAELETALTAIDTQLSGEKQIWLFPLFLICLAIPWVKEKYDQLAGLITQHKNLKNQISDDELRRKHQTLMDALDRKRQALIDALNQKFQALAALGIEFQSQAENNCKFDEKFLKSKDKKILSFISAGEWKLTSREENIEGITLPALPHCVFPQIIMFPFDKPFYGKLYETDAAVRLLLLRLLFALPVGAVELTVIDPLNLGRSFLEFMPLRSIEGLVQDNCCLTRSKDIESALSDLCNYLESLMQEKQIAKWVGKDKNKNPVDKNENPVKDYDKNENPLQDKAGREISPFAPYANYLANWPVYDLSDIKKPVSIEYKARKEISLLPYKLVLIYGFPEQFSDSSITYLKRILEIGPLLGVLPIVLLDYYCHDLLSRLRSNWKSYTDSLSNAELEKATDHLRRYWKTMEEVRQHKSADILMAIYNGVISNITGDFPETLRRLECKVVPEPEPQPEKFDEYVHWISNAYKERLKIEKVIKEQVWGIIKPSDAWKQNSSLNGISALVGWNVEKEEVEIRFVDAVSHAFIGGVSGAGKSNLLHDIIHNLIHK